MHRGPASPPAEPHPQRGDGARAPGPPQGCRAGGVPSCKPGVVTPSPRVFRQLSLDKQLIDFGSYVVGETASRTITLTNTGGLGTRFKFLLASESCEMDASHSVLKRVSCGLCSRQRPGVSHPRRHPARGNRPRLREACWQGQGVLRSVPGEEMGPHEAHPEATGPCPCHTCVGQVPRP